MVLYLGHPSIVLYNWRRLDMEVYCSVVYSVYIYIYIYICSINDICIVCLHIYLRYSSALSMVYVSEMYTIGV